MARFIKYPHDRLARLPNGNGSSFQPGKSSALKAGIASLLLGSALTLSAQMPNAFAASADTAQHSRKNNIPPRHQWEANYGYCGEVSLISAGLYYGQYVSQYDARAIDQNLNEAAMDLGSRPFQVFRDITLPQSIPGIIAGGLLVFIPAAGEMVIPTLVGDAGRPMIGRVISDEFSSTRDWPMAASVSVALLALMVTPMMAYAYFQGKAERQTRKEP